MKTDRRTFLATSTLAAAGMSLGNHALSSPAIIKKYNQSDTIRMGFIGVGNRGSQLLNFFMQNNDVQIVALCDVYTPYTTRIRSEVNPLLTTSGRIPEMGEKFNGNVIRYKDFRKLLEQKDIDAVCIATPDHWHAIQTIQAMDAGKDVYVEKPLTITMKEGRAMVDAQKHTNRVCAVGLNRRGNGIYRHLKNEMTSGLLGKVTTARALHISNMYPNGIGNLQPATPPSDFDWDMWLGPRAKRDFQYNIAPYYFRWWKDYSSQMGNWGVHYMDVIRWLCGETAPVSISATGGKYILKDDRTIPDTMEVVFEFASGMIIQFSIHEANSGGGIAGGEIEINGTNASLVADERKYAINPARPGQFQSWDSSVTAASEVLKDNPKFSATAGDSTANLIRNFLDCVKSRNQPWCTLEEGHRSTSFAHLANLALEVGGTIKWDAEKERVTNNEKANELLHYEYRKPWTL